MAPKGKALAKAAVNDKKQAAAKAVEKAKEIQESETQLVASSSKAGAGLEVLSESEIKRFKSMTAYGAQKGNTFMSKAMEQYAMAPDRAAKAMLLAKFRDDPKCRWASDMTETEADTREEAQRYIKALSLCGMSETPWACLLTWTRRSTRPLCLTCLSHFRRSLTPMRNLQLGATKCGIWARLVWRLALRQ